MVTITAEQAKAIKEHRNMGRKGIINHILDLKYKTYDEDSTTTPGLSDLSEMDITTLVNALYLGYEIEQPTKEEIFWAELGREVGEMKIGDAYTHLDGRVFTVDKPLRIDTVSRMYKEGQLVGFYPAESFKRFPTGN